MALNTEYTSPAPRNRSFHSNHRQPSHYIFKSPYSQGRQSDSPDFSPFNVSSPIRREGTHFHRRNRRYFNNSDSSFSSGGSCQSSPYIKQNRQRGHFSGRHGRHNNKQPVNINLYYDPSAVEDPWEKLESELEKKESFQESESGPEDSTSSSRTSESNVTV